MQLKFTLDRKNQPLESIWLAGKRPFPRGKTGKILVGFKSCSFPRSFPRDLRGIGHLLTTVRPKPKLAFYATILLDYPSSQDSLGEIVIPLPLEIINQIKVVTNDKFDYELALENLTFSQ